MTQEWAEDEPSPSEYDGHWLTSYCLISSDSDKNVQGETSEEQQQVVPRSRWQAVLLEAGGIGAAVSEESMRRLKYCLSWLLVSVESIGSASLSPHDKISITVRDNAYRWPNLDSPRLYCVTSTATRLATCTQPRCSRIRGAHAPAHKYKARRRCHCAPGRRCRV